MGKLIHILRERAEKNAIKTYNKYLQTQNKKAVGETTAQESNFYSR